MVNMIGFFKRNHGKKVKITFGEDHAVMMIIRHVYEDHVGGVTPTYDEREIVVPYANILYVE